MKEIIYHVTADVEASVSFDAGVGLTQNSILGVINKSTGKVIYTPLKYNHMSVSRSALENGSYKYTLCFDNDLPLVSVGDELLIKCYTNNDAIPTIEVDGNSAIFHFFTLEQMTKVKIVTVQGDVVFKLVHDDGDVALYIANDSPQEVAGQWVMGVGETYAKDVYGTIYVDLVTLTPQEIYIQGVQANLISADVTWRLADIANKLASMVSKEQLNALQAAFERRFIGIEQSIGILQTDLAAISVAIKALSLQGESPAATNTEILRQLQTIQNDIYMEILKQVKEVTYNGLKALRDSGLLVPGQCYRINDYVTTVANSDEARSAGHPFDLIVTAIDDHTLSEQALAAMHAGDTYFEHCRMAAWQVWYCIDNDTDRFSWADEENGKGVIYRLIDEYRNDVPYDFKNIQYKRYRVVAAVRIGDTMYIRTPESDAHGKYAFKSWNTVYLLDNEQPEIGDTVYTYAGADSGKLVRYVTPSDLVGGYLHKNGYGYGVDESEWLWAFTFGYYEDEEVFDWTVNGENNRQCRDNVIKAYGETQELNNIVICDKDGLGDDMYGNTFGANCYENSVWGYSFYCNTFGNDCYDNSFGNECNSNTFGNECYNNSFGESCYYNSFGNGCYSNSFGNDCYSNSFGNECYYNSFGNDCCYNSFGNDCYYNSFGNSCSYNSFGNYCYNNSFGNNCGSNTFGNNCYYNSFGNDYIQCCTFGDGVQYCSIDYSTGSSNYLQYVSVLNGTRGADSSNLLELSDLAVGVSYPQTCGYNSEGDYTVKNLMD